ncbi:MAG TPA: SRPBCC domain-containing protein [Solirubrobacterales bacterium]|jgi:uncharacterized protein YndB with AHSA1/START domain
MNMDASTAERIEIDLAAPPAQVYEAIATADGVRSWWTDGTFAEEVGGVGRLEFGHGWTELRVAKLMPDSEVEWTCVGQDIEHFDPTDEWVGTKIRFRLAPIDDGRRTHLDFTHEGLAGLGCEEMCTKGWDHYIRTSLRGLVEEGDGAAGPGAGSR